MSAFYRKVFAAAVVRPITTLWMGYALRHKENLPVHGPAIVIANHNSHLDALMLLSLFPQRLIPSIRIAAAADYFFTNKTTRFLAEHVAGLVPVARTGSKAPLAPMAAVLEKGGILFLFPEGTRGSPDVMGDIKPGLWHIARRFPEVPICPVYLHGLGRAMPKGSWVPVPLFADICVGEPFFVTTDKKGFPRQVKDIFDALRVQTLAGLAASGPDLDEEE